MTTDDPWCLSLHPLFLYGVRKDVQGCIYFNNKKLVYPVGSGVALLDLESMKQELRRLTRRGSALSCWCLSKCGGLLAFAEKGDVAALVVVINMDNGKRERSLRCAGAQSNHVVALAFSSDAKFLLAQTGPPDYKLFYFFWSKGKILTTYAPSAKVGVTSVSFHPKESNVVCVVGQGSFKMLRLIEGHLKAFGYSKGDHHLMLTHDWMPNDYLVIGTKGGKLLFLYDGDLKCSVRISDLLNTHHLPSEAMGSAGSSVVSEESFVHCVLAFRRGMIVSMGTSGIVMVLRLEKAMKINEENDVKLRVQRTLSISAPKNIDPQIMGSKLIAMSLNDNETRLVGLTDTMQLVTTLFQDGLSSSMGSEVDGGKSELSILVHLFHHGPITDLDLCPRKPIAVTCGEDQTVRVWNYTTLKLELCQLFDEPVLSVALHPSGLYVACGFGGRLRLLSLMVHEIRAFREFHLRNVHLVAFSHGGHLVAGVNDTQDIFVYCTISFVSKMCLKGHRGRVSSLVFSPDDLSLVSCGLDGVLYEFDLTSGKRKYENVAKECSFTNVVTFSLEEEPKVLRHVVLASDKSVKVYEKEVMLASMDLHSINLASMTLRSDDSYSICGAMDGSIIDMRWPLKLPLQWRQHEMHGDVVGKLKLSVDGQRLITISRDGSMGIWSMDNRRLDDKLDNKGEIAHKYAQETLISNEDLQDIDQLIADLRQQVEETRTERDYQLRLKTNTFNEELKRTKDEYTDNLSEQMAKVASLEEELRRTTEREEIKTNSMREENELKVNQTATHYKNKLIIEYDRVKQLESELKDLEINFQQQLMSEKEKKRRELEDLRTNMDITIRDKEQEVQKRETDAERRVSVISRVLHDTELDADKELMELRTQYEQQLRLLSDEVGKAKSERAFLQKKYETAMEDSKEHRHLEARLSSERVHQSAVIRALDKSVDELKKEVKLRDTVITNKEQKSAAIRDELGDKDRKIFVLQHKLQLLRSQLEKAKITGNEEEKNDDPNDHQHISKEDFDPQNPSYEHKLIVLRRQLRVVKGELSREKRRSQTLSSARHRCSADMEQLKTALKSQDDGELRIVAKRLCYQYSGPRHSLCTLDDSTLDVHHDDANDGTVEELLKQNTRLQRINDQLKHQLQTKEKVHEAERREKLHQIHVLIKELDKVSGK